MTRRRLSRAERKRDTRERLLDSAARVFARRGFHSASVEAVAEEAGFTKGAVYSNFTGKEDLFLAMLEARFAERLEAVRAAAAAPGGPGEAARRGGESFVSMLAADPQWPVLFMEFWAYAQRNAAVRRRFAAQVRNLRRAISEIFEARADALGLELPVPAEQLAAMTFAMATGIALERGLDPQSVPDPLFGAMLEMFFAGVRAASKPRDAVPAQ